MAEKQKEDKKMKTVVGPNWSEEFDRITKMLKNSGVNLGKIQLVCHGFESTSCR